MLPITSLISGIQEGVAPHSSTILNVAPIYAGKHMALPIWLGLFVEELTDTWCKDVM